MDGEGVWGELFVYFLIRMGIIVISADSTGLKYWT